MQLLCLKVTARYLGSVCGAQIRSSSCLAAGYNLNGVVKLVGGTVFAVAVICDCLALGSVCGAQTRSSSCLAAGYNLNGVVKLVGGTVFAVAVICDCLALGSVCGALGRQAAWRPGTI